MRAFRERAASEQPFVCRDTALKVWTEEIPVHVLADDRHHDRDESVLDGFRNPLPAEDSVREMTLAGGRVEKIHPELRRRSLPSLLIYDTHGLELFEELTKLEDEYYLTACERSLLETHMDAIATHIPDGAAIIELGCGSMTKTTVILDHLSNVAKKKNLRFYGLDIDDTYLRRSLEDLRSRVEGDNGSGQGAITYAGIHGSYEGLLSFLADIPGPRFILWLGSSVGNMTRQEAAELLRLYGDAMDSGDGFFLGVDKLKDPKITLGAYNDSQGRAAALCMNSLYHVNRLLGQNVFDVTKFQAWPGYDAARGELVMQVKSLVDQTVVIPPPFSGEGDKSAEVYLKEDELIRIFQSVKRSAEDIAALSAAAGLTVEQIWTDPKEMFYFALLKKSGTNE